MDDASVADSGSHKRLAVLSIGAIGVVFGDIGTSPLYAFREALNQAGERGIGPDAIIGVLSLALWSLILVVTVKYVLFLMRADNEGEGGVLALLALAGRALGGRKPFLIALGAIGAALFYGDAIITPALSVLSAVEGLKTIPALSAYITQDIIIYTVLLILAPLFLIQSRGTASVARLFGPICILWFLALAALGIIHIFDEPGIFAAFLPHHAVLFLAHNGVTGLFVLGAVFLTVTGAEALTADMGHFGRVPIQLGWFALVFPALALNYLGQGAFALASYERTIAAGGTFINRDWFFLMAPDAFRVPLVVLATLATIIASQAVITGAYSVTQQAIQLGLLPRMHIRQTSESHAGQIYMPTITWLLLAGVVILIFGFKTSSAMAAAYGIAVTGTMVVTTCLAFIILRYLWKWPLAGALAFILPFLLLDIVFFGANILRVVEGGWVPLLIAAILGLLIYIWVRGKRLIALYETENATDLCDFVAVLSKRPPQRVTGIAVYLTANPNSTPGALLHNLKHNRVLHAKNLITTIKTRSVPHVPAGDRRTIEWLSDDFARVQIAYGFMETPDIPRDLAGVTEGVDKASYFIGRNSLRASADQGLPLWQDHILIFLQRNAADPTDFFQVPPNRVVELGSQVVI